jgi:CRISPR-associated endonuclease/helicase Cas3
MEPNLWLLLPDTRQNGRPDFGRSEYVYTRHILLRSWLTLRDRSCLTLPDDVEPMIEAVYDERECPSDLGEELKQDWLASREQLQSEIASAERQGREKIVKRPDYRGSVARIVQTPLEEDSPTLHQAFQAVTRLGDPTVNIVCLLDSPEAPRICSSEASIDLEQEPSLEETESLLRASLSVSHREVVEELQNHPRIPTAWRTSAFLRHHHAVIFDEMNCSDIGRYRLQLDNELGLLVYSVHEEASP